MPQRPFKPACQCRSLPSSLYEDDMPKAARATFVWHTEDTDHIAQCTACSQFWQFDYLGRLEVPTYQKVDARNARFRIDAWHAAKPEREAKAAATAARMAAWDAEIEAQEKAYAAAEALAKTPLSRTLQYLAMLGFGVGTLVALYSIIMQRGNPPPEMVLFAGGCYVMAMVSAALHAWRMRPKT
jgi:hypothetical protein